jgi:hypothetical protein
MCGRWLCRHTVCVNEGLERARRGGRALERVRRGEPRGAPAKRRGGAEREGEVRRVLDRARRGWGNDAQETEGQTGSEHGVDWLR